MLTNSIKESGTYLSGQLFLNTPHKSLNTQEKSKKKMHFSANCGPSFKIKSLWCPQWGHPVKPMKLANSKKTEFYWGKTAAGKSAWIKA